MVRRTKIALVLGGYALAVVAAVVAGGLYDAWAARQTFDTSGGMYAGGQLLQALGAFLLVALAPTALALWFLRGNELFWNAVAVAALAFAATGLVAVLEPQASRGRCPSCCSTSSASHSSSACRSGSPRSCSSPGSRRRHEPAARSRSRSRARP
jgi:hypothetical protein